MRWTYDGFVWFSDCGRYCANKTASTAVGPWYLTHDPAGENAGWGEMIVRYSDTLKGLKACAELHAEGVLPAEGTILDSGVMV